MVTRRGFTVLVGNAVPERRYHECDQRSRRWRPRKLYEDVVEEFRYDGCAIGLIHPEPARLVEQDWIEALRQLAQRADVIPSYRRQQPYIAVAPSSLSICWTPATQASKSATSHL